MGIRHLLSPPLPARYYGNAFQSTNVVLTGKDLNEWPLSRVAKMIKESKKVASDTNYIWNSINLLKTLRHHKMKIETGSECLEHNTVYIVSQVSRTWQKATTEGGEGL
ncbi:hypothetical protein RJ639_034868 [Escallonia herrerae]|uniref:Uncharacterized protein n=1 Tax=Escallonia herrerae TaxID=1293975 RepID=A0AA89BB45_9ASTE|nr:hypothetical protein RJ639_034868 [Escallonia herrerae]